MTLEDLLIKHEDLKLKPYRDSVGKLTIGVGRNLDDVGITKNEARALLANDILRVRAEAAKFPWFGGLSTVRQNAVLDMLFNLGLGRFMEFHQMIAALQAGNFEKVATEMLSSKWASQVGERAQDLAGMMRNNV